MNFTEHAVEAVRQLWMIPYTICDATEPDETVSQSIRRKIRIWSEGESYILEDHRSFTITACAMSMIASKAIIDIIANAPDGDNHGPPSELLNEDLRRGHATIDSAVTQHVLHRRRADAIKRDFQIKPEIVDGEIWNGFT